MHETTSRISIWWINQFALPPSQPGGGRHSQLAHALGNNGCDVTIVSSSLNYMTGEKLEALSNYAGNFIQIPIGWRGPAGIGKLFRMRAFGNKVSRGKWADNLHKPDIIIGSSPSLHAALGASKLALKLQVPFILEVRDIWPLSLVEVAGVSAKHPVVNHLYKLESAVVNRATRIISLLPNAGSYFSKLGVSESDIDWVPNGVEMNMFPDKEQKERKNIVVTYVGSLGPPNGVATILGAAKIIQTIAPEITFRIIGDGSSKEELTKYAVAQNIKTVTFEPAIPREQVPAELEKASILVANVPNHDLYKYGISLNKLYEYLASGKPIALGTSAADDPLTAAGVGPVVPPDDARKLADRIMTIASMTQKERQSLGEKGREFVQQNNTFEVLAKRILLSVQKAIQK